jgi:mannose-6-phosphate isomerase-like protein (cupin superfamily)
MRGQTHAFAVAAALAAATACKHKVEPPPPSKIEADLPMLEAMRLSTKAACERVRCERAVPNNAPTSDATPFAIWEEDALPSSHVVIPRNAALDVLGVMLEGELKLTVDENDKPLEVLERHAFLARGAGVTLLSSGLRGSSRVLLAAVTAGEPIRSVMERAPEPWTERPAPVAVVDLTSLPDLAWGQGAYHARIAFGTDASPRASLAVLRMSADAPVAAHLHETEWEHMAILQGDGSFVQTYDDQARTTHLEDGAVISIPPRARHEWRPGGKRPFLGIQLYTPPGPEQRFKKLAAP